MSSALVAPDDSTLTRLSATTVSTAVTPEAGMHGAKCQPLVTYDRMQCNLHTQRAIRADFAGALTLQLPKDPLHGIGAPCGSIVSILAIVECIATSIPAA